MVEFHSSTSIVRLRTRVDGRQLYTCLLTEPMLRGLLYVVPIVAPLEILDEF